MISYIETEKISKIFQSYNLNTSNILDFLIEEDNDNLKYLLKLYLLSTLEDYKHIEKLLDCVFYNRQFNETPSSEIINKRKIKQFWELVREHQFIKDHFAKRRWVHNHLATYMNYLENLPATEASQNRLLSQIKKESNPLKKLKLKYRLLKETTSSKQRIKEIEESYLKYFNSLDGFNEMSQIIEAAKEYVTKQEEKDQQEKCRAKKEEYQEILESFKRNEITIQELKQKLYNINKQSELEVASRLEWFEPTIFVKKIINFAKNYFDERNIIDFLKEDLIFNYFMIVIIFSKELWFSDDLKTILHNIRTYMMDYDINGKNHTNDSHLDFLGLNFGTNPLSPEYRETNLRTDSLFFRKTAKIEEIPEKMNQLFARYENIRQLEDDTQYAYACYKLSQDLVQIHPYSNGNGRTSKYLFYILLLKRNILPFTITDNNTITHCYENLQTNPENYFEYRNKLMKRRSEL